MNIIQTNTSRVLLIAPEYSMTPEVISSRAFLSVNSMNPTNEARAGSNLFELCLASRRKTIGQKVTPIL